MTMGHGTKQRAVGVGFGQISDCLLATGVKGFVGDVGACGRRALDDVERRLEHWVLDSRSHYQLCRHLFVSHLEHRKLIRVEGYRPLGTRVAHADEILARHLASLDEFTLGPVAHELRAGRAFNHHRRGQIPVAT